MLKGARSTFSGCAGTVSLDFRHAASTQRASRRAPCPRPQLGTTRSVDFRAFRNPANRVDFLPPRPEIHRLQRIGLPRCRDAWVRRISIRSGATARRASAAVFLGVRVDGELERVRARVGNARVKPLSDLVVVVVPPINPVQREIIEVYARPRHGRWQC